MWKALSNCWKVPEIKKRILFTLGVLILCRLLANIPCPGIMPEGLKQLFENLNSKGGGELPMLLDLFTGGAMKRFAVAGLGIMPYITASIIMSLLGPVVPTIEKWKREGETGYQKINNWTRGLTVIICLFQGIMFATTMANAGGMMGGSTQVEIVSPVISHTFFVAQSVLVLMCGTLLLMWLGEQITEKGIGQGASLIITVGILTRLPDAISRVLQRFLAAGETADAGNMTIVHVFLLAVVFVMVTAAVVGLTLGTRKVPIQYARARAGRSGGVGGGAGQGSFFPLRVNFAGVMPIIFGSTLLMVPGLVARFIVSRPAFPKFVRDGANFVSNLLSRGSSTYLLFYAGLIIFFCFFWVNSQFNPVKIADDLKRAGAYVPGHRPGNETAQYLSWTMWRVTTAGALSLTIVALLPSIFTQLLKVDYVITQFFGGTSMLIMVGVVLDTMRQLETYLLSHGGYETFMKKGRVKGRGGINIPGVAQ